MTQKALVLDANILIRAVLGPTVRDLILGYADGVDFFVPAHAVADVNEHLPALLKKRGIDDGVAVAVLQTLMPLLHVLDVEAYADFEPVARPRLEGRDEEDWPILASALALGCPIWTQDQDFFGTGVPTWTTKTVEHYLAG